MEIKRAREITSSPVMVNVTYQGNAIYIESVDDNNGMASIYPLNQPNNKQSVPVTSLIEH